GGGGRTTRGLAMAWANPCGAATSGGRRRGGPEGSHTNEGSAKTRKSTAVVAKALRTAPALTNGSAASSATIEPAYPTAKPQPDRRPCRSGGASSISQAL